MGHPKIVEPLEVPHVDREKLTDAVNVHAGRNTRVVDLHALTVVLNYQHAPAFVRLAAIRQQFEIPLDHTRETIGLRDAQAETVFV